MKNMQKYEQLAITELDAYLFGQGTHYEIYNKMGAHVGVKDGKEGVYFAVWAPAAREVYVIGEFNNWNAYGYDMKKISDGGIYDLSKHRIEQTMDTLVKAFETQLDKLFASDALDVSTDIDVMQNMLRADGLTDDAPFKL